jgi:hypothetical protein
MFLVFLRMWKGVVMGKRGKFRKRVLKERKRKKLRAVVEERNTREVEKGQKVGLSLTMEELRMNGGMRGDSGQDDGWKR